MKLTGICEGLFPSENSRAKEQIRLSYKKATVTAVRLDDVLTSSTDGDVGVKWGWNVGDEWGE